MNQIQRTSVTIRATEKQLEPNHPDGCAYIMSSDNPLANSVGGQVTHVTLRGAAELIVKGAARIATPAEVEAFLERGRKQTEINAGRDLSHSEMSKTIALMAKRSANRER